MRWGRWLLVVAAGLVLAVGLARVFSGPEDTWIRGPGGRWVAHGHPAGPPPAADFRPSLAERATPWLVLGLFAMGALASAARSPRAPAGRGDINHMVRVLGTVSGLSWVASLCVLVGLAGLLMGRFGTALQDAGAALLAVAGLAAFFGLLGAQMHVAKKVLEAHYDLKRSLELLQDAVERLGKGEERPGPAMR